MTSTIAKLLTLIALLLMPFGMAAAAPATGHHSASASSAMEHCPSQGATPAAKGGISQCTMVCAAALPAVERRAEPRLPFLTTPAPRMATDALFGLHPETATPPPRIV